MKKLLTVLVVTIFAAGFGFAQPKNHIGIGLNLSLPMGTFGDNAGIGIGGTVSYEMGFTPNITGIVSAGYIKYGGKDITTPYYTLSYGYSDIPIMVGAKYYFTPKNPLYAIAQIGFQIFNANATSSSTVPGYSYTFSASGSSTEFAFAVGAGYEIPIGPKNAIDVTGTFNLISNLNYIGARVAYRFGM